MSHIFIACSCDTHYGGDAFECGAAKGKSASEASGLDGGIYLPCDCDCHKPSTLKPGVIDDANWAAGFRAGYFAACGATPFQSEVDEAHEKWVANGRKTHLDLP